MTRVVYSVDIAAPAQEVFNAVVDWRGQDRWVPLTIVRAGRQAGIAVGGEIAVRPLDAENSRFYWAEDLDVPLGIVGQIGWQLVKPAFAFGIKAALKRFANLVEKGELGHRLDADEPTYVG